MAQMDTTFPIASEEIEPFAAMIIGRIFARAQEAKKRDDGTYWGALNTLWLTLDTLSKLGTCARTTTHFNIAMNNHIVQTAKYIKAEIGINPMYEPGWKWCN